MVALKGLPAVEGSYDRLWVPIITLWYFIWQWLQARHTLESVVIDASRGGADKLCVKNKRLSEGIQSKATTSFCNARQRLPLEWMSRAFIQLATGLVSLGNFRSQDLPIESLDGSTKRMRPYGDIPEQFPPHRTRRKKSYWCVARILGNFCAATGICTAAKIASIHRSEQALAVELMLERAKRVLYIGDRNFGVWRVARAAVQSGGHALVRLTAQRARRLFGRKRLPGLLDQAVEWSPHHDQIDPGLSKASVSGRLIIIKAQRRGYRAKTLFLFTTLTDVQAYPAQRLLEIYGWRWRAELNFRALKTTMQMDQSEVKSADMVSKEFYAGLMAYNLVRGLMAAAAEQSGCQPVELSFSRAHAALASALTDLFLFGISPSECSQRLLQLIDQTTGGKLPRRRKIRPNEPRAQHYEPQVFPKMKASRAEARDALKKSLGKS